MSLRRRAATSLNVALRPLRIQVVAGTSPDPAVRGYVSARKTLAEARRARLPVGTYIDQTFARPGATPEAVRAMIDIADLQSCARVCEIGPGSGRYAEEVIKAFHPQAYEIYETARDWLPHLRHLPNVEIRNADGHTLGETADASVDLVHAHKVFVYLDFFATLGYLCEMARVVRPGGIVAFDLVTEPCLNDEIVLGWSRRGTIYRPVPRDWIVEFLRRRELVLRGSHIEPLPVGHGNSELLVFQRPAQQ